MSSDPLVNREGLIDYMTLVDLLRRRAAESADQRAFTYLPDGEREEIRLSYAELDRQARAIGATLQSRGGANARALLLYPPGLGFLSAFFGCLYAGVVAVPIYPPRLNRSLDRLQAIVADAQASFALTTAQTLSQIEVRDTTATNLAKIQWLSTDQLDEAMAESWRSPNINPDSLAFLQYTSGSTTEPKGVKVTHRSLRHNESMMQRAFGQTKESIIAGWLPLYHDMGLIGNVLQPLHIGAHCILMSPASFLQSPFRWLDMISRYRATTSGAPNFAYDLCVEKIGPELRQKLDLSSWSVAFNGAEPVREETLRNFSEAFEGAGFRREAFFPCYGLAEATLFVTGGVKNEAPVLKTVQREGLRRGRVVGEIAGSKGAATLVGCGRAWLEQKAVVVHPESGAICAPDEIGEIWVSGPSVAEGYWNRPEETAACFSARLSETGAGPFLRTGDLGFSANGELFVTGRLKDLIIIRGRNHYPQDIEHTAWQSHPDLEPASGAAFSIEVEGEERLIIVQEVRRRWRKQQADEMLAAIRGAVAAEHELQVYAVVLVSPLSLPKTSSGKIRRRACRVNYLTDGLEAVASARFEEPALTKCGLVGGESLREALNRCATESERRLWVEAYLIEQLKATIKGAPDLFDPDRPLVNQGIDSLSALELQRRIESDFGIALSFQDLVDRLSFVQLTDLLLSKKSSSFPMDQAEECPWREESAPRDSRWEFPLSFAQQGLWFLDQLSPNNAAYHIPAAVRIKGPLDFLAFRQSLEEIFRRHEILRTGYASFKGRPYPIISSSPALPLILVDFQGISIARAEEVAERLAAAATEKPFNLAETPLARAALIRFGATDHLAVFTFHHIISDGWSMSLLLRELSVLYEAFREGRPSSLPELLIQYKEYARWQRNWLQGSALEDQVGYWRERLAGADLSQKLPTDHEKPAEATSRAGVLSRTLPPAVYYRVKAQSRRNGVTLFMTLASVVFVLLKRYSGQDDVLLGMNISNRQRRGTAEMIGLFVNTLALRVDLSEDPTFLELLGRVREAVLGAFAHQDAPYDKVMESMQPGVGRDRAQIFQALLVLQNLPSLALRFSDLSLVELKLHPRDAKLDLSFFVEETGNDLTITMEYNRDLFESATCEQMIEHFQTLLTDATANVEKRISDLSLEPVWKDSSFHLRPASDSFRTSTW